MLTALLRTTDLKYCDPSDIMSCNPTISACTRRLTLLYVCLIAARKERVEKQEARERTKEEAARKKRESEEAAVKEAEPEAVPEAPLAGDIYVLSILSLVLATDCRGLWVRLWTVIYDAQT